MYMHMYWMRFFDVTLKGKGSPTDDDNTMYTTDPATIPVHAPKLYTRTAREPGAGAKPPTRALHAHTSHAERERAREPATN